MTGYLSPGIAGVIGRRSGLSDRRLRIVRRGRKRDTEFRIPRTRPDLDITAVASYQLPRDVQALPGSLAWRLGREKRLEDSVADLRRNPGSIVDHVDDNELQKVRGVNRDMPGIPDRVDRIV